MDDAKTDPITMRFDLCTPPAKFGGYVFTCESMADNATTWPCTGSAHAYGEHILCTCSCHQRRANEARDRCSSFLTPSSGDPSVRCARRNGHEDEHRNGSWEWGEGWWTHG